MSYTDWAATSTAHAAYRAATTRCDEAFATDTDPAPVTPVLGTWTHPGTRETRRYVNNIREIIGLDVSYYRSGNISQAALDGDTISNCEANRIMAAIRNIKIWVDDAGQVHCRDRNRSWAPRTVDFDAIVTAVIRSIDYVQAA